MELTHQLWGDRVTVGRLADNTIQIAEPVVSSNHAEFIAEDGHYRLRDLESTNLTFVDGVPVKDFHLHQPCRIAFGTVECVFDPLAAAPAEAVMTREQLETDAAFLRSENAELHAKLAAQQRRMDMLSSARLVTGRTDSTPSAAAQDALRAVTSERDDLRHTIAGLKLELGNLAEELAAARQERDALRRTVETVQMEKLGLARELGELRGTRIKPLPPTDGITARPSPRPGALTSRDPASALSAMDPKATQKLMLPMNTAFQAVAAILNSLRGALDRAGAVPGDDLARMELMTLATELVNSTAGFKDHPVARAAVSVEALLHELLAQPGAMDPGTAATLTGALDMLARLVEPRPVARPKPPLQTGAQAAQDNEESPARLVASLELAHLQPTAC